MIPTNVRPQRSVAGRMAAAVVSAFLLLACLPTVAAFHDPDLGGYAGFASPAAQETAGQADAGAAEPAAEPIEAVEAVVAEATGHLVVSEVTTGGASASDEFIELYNPGPLALPLEGLEVIYVTASGGTITRKANWASGAPSMAPGTHVLIANAAGAFAAVADVTYTNGLAATGGSLAIRILGAGSAIDAVGWGNATSIWLEGLPAAAAAAGHSIERLPGGVQGSGQDTDQNSVDFIESATPDPQNSLSPPIALRTPEPSPTVSASPTSDPTSDASPTPTTPGSPQPTAQPSATPLPTPPATPSPTSQPTATPSQPALTIAEARAQPDGTSVTVEGVSLTDSAFADGGGYLADASGGIAVLLGDGSFPRGQQVRVAGDVDDRFSQRTIRADAGGVTVIGPASEPSAAEVSTGAIGEAFEGELVEVAGTIASSPTTLTTGIAVDVDDGSGAVRVMVGSATGIDTSTWMRGASLRLRGVVGQRDSSGTGTAGYRVQPRDASDVLGSGPPATPTPSPSPSGDPSAISIKAARAQPVNTRVTVRGTVTLASNMADEGTAAIQDSSGAILLRLGDDVGSLELQLGELLEVYGTRSTKSGMETIRLSAPPRHLGRQAQPDPRRRPTGSLGEEEEAVLVIARGEVTTSPRRTSAQNIYFDVDDGSGPIQIFLTPRSGASVEGIVIGSWVEVRGVLGQETSGKLPDRGYRIWPRVAADLEVVATAPGTDGGTGGAPSNGDGPAAPGSGAGAAPDGTQAGGTPAAQQRVPGLGLTAATASAAPSSRRAGRGGEVASGADEGASKPEPAAAGMGLLALGGLLLTSAGGLVVPPGRPGQLLRALWHRIRSRPELEEEEAASGPSAVAEPMPALVPLTVLDGAQRTPRSSGERILPPT